MSKPVPTRSSRTPSSKVAGDSHEKGFTLVEVMVSVGVVVIAAMLIAYVMEQQSIAFTQTDRKTSADQISLLLQQEVLRTQADLNQWQEGRCRVRAYGSRQELVYTSEDFGVSQLVDSICDLGSSTAAFERIDSLVQARIGATNQAPPSLYVGMIRAAAMNLSGVNTSHASLQMSDQASAIRQFQIQVLFRVGNSVFSHSRQVTGNAQ